MIENQTVLAELRLARNGQDAVFIDVTPIDCQLAIDGCIRDSRREVTVVEIKRGIRLDVQRERVIKHVVVKGEFRVTTHINPSQLGPAGIHIFSLLRMDIPGQHLEFIIGRALLRTAEHIEGAVERGFHQNAGLARPIALFGHVWFGINQVQRRCTCALENESVLDPFTCGTDDSALGAITRHDRLRFTAEHAENREVFTLLQRENLQLPGGHSAEHRIVGLIVSNVRQVAPHARRFDMSGHDATTGRAAAHAIDLVKTAGQHHVNQRVGGSIHIGKLISVRSGAGDDVVVRSMSINSVWVWEKILSTIDDSIPVVCRIPEHQTAAQAGAVTHGNEWGSVSSSGFFH